MSSRVELSLSEFLLVFTVCLNPTDDLDIDAMDDDELADRNIFSDPESEWVRRSSLSDPTESDEQPESDQRMGNSYVTYAD